MHPTSRSTRRATATARAWKVLTTAIAGLTMAMTGASASWALGIDAVSDTPTPPGLSGPPSSAPSGSPPSAPPDTGAEHELMVVLTVGMIVAGAGLVEIDARRRRRNRLALIRSTISGVNTSDSIHLVFLDAGAAGSYAGF